VPPARLSTHPSDHKFTMELRAGKTPQNQTLNSDQSHCICPIFR
jgi:hypothetical protein